MLIQLVQISAIMAIAAILAILSLPRNRQNDGHARSSISDQRLEELQLSAVDGNLPLPAKIAMEVSKINALAGHRSAIEVPRQLESQRRFLEKRRQPVEREESILSGSKHDAPSLILTDEATVGQPVAICLHPAGSIGGDQQRVRNHRVRGAGKSFVPVLLSKIDQTGSRGRGDECPMPPIVFARP